MLHRIPRLIAATIASSSVLVLAQGGGAIAGSAGVGTGTSASSANAGGSAPSGMGTNASSASPSAPPGMGTQDTGTGANSNTQVSNPNVQPATLKSRAAVQAERNAGVGHARNGLPIGAIGTGTSNEDQLIISRSSNRNRPAAEVDGNAGATPGNGGSLSDQVSQPRAARAGEKVLDAKAQVDRRTTVSRKRVPDLKNGGL
jgi:hypothetical protein